MRTKKVFFVSPPRYTRTQSPRAFSLSPSLSLSLSRPHLAARPPAAGTLLVSVGGTSVHDDRTFAIVRSGKASPLLSKVAPAADGQGNYVYNLPEAEVSGNFGYNVRARVAGAGSCYAALCSGWEGDRSSSPGHFRFCPLATQTEVSARVELASQSVVRLVAERSASPDTQPQSPRQRLKAHHTSLAPNTGERLPSVCPHAKHNRGAGGAIHAGDHRKRLYLCRHLSAWYRRILAQTRMEFVVVLYSSTTLCSRAHTSLPAVLSSRPVQSSRRLPWRSRLPLSLR